VSHFCLQSGRVNLSILDSSLRHFASIVIYFALCKPQLQQLSVKTLILAVFTADVCILKSRSNNLSLANRVMPLLSALSFDSALASASLG
jgi:hypothetical protein